MLNNPKHFRGCHFTWSSEGSGWGQHTSREETIQTKVGGLVRCLEVSWMLPLGIHTSFYILRETEEGEHRSTRGSRGEPSSSLQ